MTDSDDSRVPYDFTFPIAEELLGVEMMDAFGIYLRGQIRSRLARDELTPVGPINVTILEKSGSFRGPFDKTIRVAGYAVRE